MEHGGDEDAPQIYHDILSLPPLQPEDAFSSSSNIDLLLNELMEEHRRATNESDVERQLLQAEPATTTTQPCDIFSSSHLASSAEHVGDNGYPWWLSSGEMDGFDHVDPSTFSVSSSHASSPGIGLPKTSRNNRLSSEAVNILTSWLYEHSDHPYPTDLEKAELQYRTGLSKSQLRNWFGNARRRKLIPTPDLNPKPNGDSLLSPMERWKNSPPENEAATTSDIVRALADMPDDSDASSLHSAPLRNSFSTGSSATSPNVFGPASVSSFEHSQSSGSELSFTHSQGPYVRPPTPINPTRSRRRHWKASRSTTAFNKRKAQCKRTFKCTFCADSFYTKYDWQRHEKALHLPVDQWTCAPDGGIIEIDGTSVCVFCHAQDVDSHHLNQHSYLICRQKPAEQRVFSRKDHLRQHLQLTHKAEYQSWMASWRSLRSHIVSRCGFCDATFNTWDERVDHIADHFKRGADMIQWRGLWGFEPAIQTLVENAMPPYLLGHEEKTADPWKTSDALGTVEDEESPLTTDVPTALTRYDDLQRDLIIYIRGHIEEGNPPSDQMIEDKARELAYGNNDRWNQTYADDPIWLDFIKQTAGLS